MEKEIFKEIGFTEGEIKVYLALFELGETTVGPISKKSGISHAKVYPILEKLIEKGLVSWIVKDSRKNFSATNPSSLLELINRKTRSLEEEKARIREIIPSLLEKQKAKEKTQSSRVFEGFKGLRNLFQELFENNKNKEICVFGLNELLKNIEFQNFFLFYHELRQRNKIKLKLILSKESKNLIEKYPKKLYTKQDKIKFVESVFPVGLFIIGEHVVSVVSEDKVTAFDIQSSQNAERYKEFFDFIWDRGE